MALFDPAFQRTVFAKEGGDRVDLGYSNRGADLGGETVLGISRVWNAGWRGWRIVDELKRRPDFPDNLDAVRGEVVGLAKGLYRIEYWNRVRGDAVQHQVIAEKLFDCAVLKDSTDAARFLQRLLNVFNRRGTLWPDIKVDGRIGPVTLWTLQRYLQKRKASRLIAYFNALMGAGFVELAERMPSQEENVYGWGARLWSE